MLNNIRKKVSDAIQEGISLSENISTSLRTSQSFENTKIDLGIPPDIKLDAGTDLLHKNEETWKHLHEANEINAEKAEEIDKIIIRSKNRTQEIFTNLTDLNASIEAAADLENTLNHCVDLVNSIQSQCKSFEEKLVVFEDFCEEIDLQERQLEHKVQISLYKQNKMNELEKVRQKLVEQHANNVLRMESELKKLQLERQAVFQESFQQDLELYKQQGSIPQIEHIKKLPQPQLSLEEIVLDDEEENKTKLENFLNE